MDPPSFKPQWLSSLDTIARGSGTVPPASSSSQDSGSLPDVEGGQSNHKREVVAVTVTPVDDGDDYDYEYSGTVGYGDGYRSRGRVGRASARGRGRERGGPAGPSGRTGDGGDGGGTAYLGVNTLAASRGGGGGGGGGNGGGKDKDGSAPRARSRDGRSSQQKQQQQYLTPFGDSGPRIGARSVSDTRLMDDEGDDDLRADMRRHSHRDHDHSHSGSVLSGSKESYDEQFPSMGEKKRMGLREVLAAPISIDSGAPKPPSASTPWGQHHKSGSLATSTTSGSSQSISRVPSSVLGSQVSAGTGPTIAASLSSGTTGNTGSAGDHSLYLGSSQVSVAAAPPGAQVAGLPRPVLRTSSSLSDLDIERAFIITPSAPQQSLDTIGRKGRKKKKRTARAKSTQDIGGTGSGAGSTAVGTGTGALGSKTPGQPKSWGSTGTGKGQSTSGASGAWGTQQLPQQHNMHLLHPQSTGGVAVLSKTNTRHSYFKDLRRQNDQASSTVSDQGDAETGGGDAGSGGTQRPKMLTKSLSSLLGSGSGSGSGSSGVGGVSLTPVVSSDDMLRSGQGTHGMSVSVSLEHIIPAATSTMVSSHTSTTPVSGLDGSGSGSWGTGSGGNTSASVAPVVTLAPPPGLGTQNTQCIKPPPGLEEVTPFVIRIEPASPDPTPVSATTAPAMTVKDATTVTSSAPVITHEEQDDELAAEEAFLRQLGWNPNYDDGDDDYEVTLAEMQAFREKMEGGGA